MKMYSRIPPREQNESADHWTTRILADLSLMTVEEMKRAMLDIWNDGYKRGIDVGINISQDHEQS